MKGGELGEVRTADLLGIFEGRRPSEARRDEVPQRSPREVEQIMSSMFMGTVKPREE